MFQILYATIEQANPRYLGGAKAANGMLGLNGVKVEWNLDTKSRKAPFLIRQGARNVNMPA